MKNVLIVGGSGFIGYHLSTLLDSHGINVTVVDIASPMNRFPGNIKFVKSNIIDAELNFNNFDYVVHLAALVGVKRGITDPLGSIQSNYETTKYLAEQCTKAKVPIFFSSTSEVYGINDDVPLSETSQRIVGPPNDSRWVYSDSKALAERLLLSYSYTSGLDVKIGRLFNVSGPYQAISYGMVIPRFVSFAISGKPLTVYGNGTQTRAFCHVYDAVNAIYLIMRHGISGEVYNIGNPQEISILSLAETVISKTGSKSAIKFIPYSEIYDNYTEIYRRVPNINKIALLGWLPERSLFDIIDDVRESLS